MSRYIKPILLQGVALLSLATLATGCASTATGLSQSRLNTISSPQKLTADLPPGTIMAVVRYPAFIDTAAQDKFYDLYGRRTIGGTTSSDDAGVAEVRGIADIMVLKSNYFALSLFKELAERMPEHSVLLSPHAIKLDANGRLTSEPMTQAESLPNIVSVDFAAYTFPDAKRMMEGEPLSFGDIVTPLVTVRTDHRASAATQGVLLTSRPILRGAVANGRQTAAQSMVNIEKGQLDGNVPELDFITFLNNTVPVRVVSQNLTSRPSQNTLSTLPIEKIKLSGEKIRNFNIPSEGITDPLEEKYSAGLANQVVGLVNQMDLKKATMVGHAGAISQFDESLAALTLIGSTDADYQARTKYADRLLEAEQKYLSVQSLRLFDGVYNGELGAQVRDILKAEYDILEKRRALARKQNLSTGLAVLATVAAGAAIASQSGSSRTTLGEQLAINALIQGAIFSGSQAFSYSRRSANIGNNYFASIIPALDEQISVQVDLIDSNETITAIRYEDLSAKLQTLYDEKQRALDVVATRCGYVGSGAQKSGTWMGVCENGLANGAGVGVLRNLDGSAMEYYGYAENGQPQGPGYMIVHGLTGTHTLEGNFQNGQADGVMRVSNPGKSDVTRLYRAGQDVGSAPRGQGVMSPFDNLIVPVSPVAFIPPARVAALAP
ncbi:MAG: hypothetical protein ABJG88_09560 [Litorimonas sp.]